MKQLAWSAKQNLQSIAGRIVPALVLVLTLSAYADEPENTPTTPDTSAAPQATPPPAPVEAEIAPNFTLPNAQAGLTRIKWPREKAVFLTFGEQASQTAIQAWSKRMKDTYGARMEFVGVAWLARVPKEMHLAAETIIKAQYPDVLIDKSGSCADRYQCKPGEVNAFVIAPDGTILKRIHEPITEERFAEVQELLEPFTKKE